VPGRKIVSLRQYVEKQRELKTRWLDFALSKVQGDPYPAKLPKEQAEIRHEVLRNGVELLEKFAGKPIKSAAEMESTLLAYFERRHVEANETDAEEVCRKWQDLADTLEGIADDLSERPITTPDEYEQLKRRVFEAIAETLKQSEDQ